MGDSLGWRLGRWVGGWVGGYFTCKGVDGPFFEAFLEGMQNGWLVQVG